MMKPITAIQPSLAGTLRAGLIAVAAVLALGACKTTETTLASPLQQGYTCCNLRYDGDWISDSNYANLPMIPAGTPIKVLSYGRDRAHVDLGGKPFRLGHDYGRAEESTERWVSKIVVSADPKPQLAAYPRQIQAAIRAGQVMKGMTREQVIMSVGYPLTSENRSLDAPVWRLWWSSFGEYQVEWDKQGRVKDITGHPETLKMMVYKP